MPTMPHHLFYPYLGGLFDAEGHIELRRNKSSLAKIRQIAIYSINKNSLNLISQTMIEQGALPTLLK